MLSARRPFSSALSEAGNRKDHQHPHTGFLIEQKKKRAAGRTTDGSSQENETLKGLHLLKEHTWADLEKGVQDVKTETLAHLLEIVLIARACPINIT